MLEVLEAACSCRWSAANLAVSLPSHLGRPKGVDQRYSLARVTAHLSALLEMEVSCACVAPPCLAALSHARSACPRLPPVALRCSREFTCPSQPRAC